MCKVIISVLGHDRPGIVAAVANVLFEQNCNIENVSQTILQTEFSGSFIVKLPQDFPVFGGHANIDSAEFAPDGLDFCQLLPL